MNRWQSSGCKVGPYGAGEPLKNLGFYSLSRVCQGIWGTCCEQLQNQIESLPVKLLSRDYSWQGRMRSGGDGMCMWMCFRVVWGWGGKIIDSYCGKFFSRQKEEKRERRCFVKKTCLCVRRRRVKALIWWLWEDDDDPPTPLMNNKWKHRGRGGTGNKGMDWKETRVNEQIPETKYSSCCCWFFRLLLLSPD